MEVGTEPEKRNTAEEQTERAEQLWCYKTSVKKKKRKKRENLNKKKPHVTFYGIIYESQTGRRLFSFSRKRISPCHLTARDCCTIPFKGHGSKTNNESSTVSPPLRIRNKEKALETSRGSVGFYFGFVLLFFFFLLQTKVLAVKAVKLHFIQLVWHQAPGQERKCTIKCDLLERQRAKKVVEEKRGDKQKREQREKGE